MQLHGFLEGFLYYERLGSTGIHCIVCAVIVSTPIIFCLHLHMKYCNISELYVYVIVCLRRLSTSVAAELC